MEFDVVLLRSEGRRRLRVDILRGMPVRGKITTEDTGSRHGLIASLWLAGTEHWRLERINVSRIGANSLVLSGIEVIADLRHAQEWWCRSPGEGPPAPYNGRPASAVRRDLSYLPA
jgi:hypothetical protein